MEFIGRKRELALLESEYRRDRAFVVVYGRRRVGKTKLIQRFIEGKNALYFLASRESEELNRRRFAQKVAETTGQGYIAEASFDDWRPLFQTLASHAADERLIIVIDELPYLVKTNSAFPSILQGIWDEILSQTNAMFILCGSSVSMMRDKVLSHDSPLYGRRTAQLRLKPLAFSELREAYPAIPYKQLVSLYAIAGGVPKYLEILDPAELAACADASEAASFFKEGIVRNALSPSGFLYEEPYFLFEQEGRDPASHLSLVSVIARGSRRAAEIARTTGMKESALPIYLKTLIDLGYIEREVPFNEDAPERSKNGLYRVADEFLTFWFRYVQPFASDLEMGNVRPSLNALEKTFESDTVPFLFERLSRQAFMRLCADGEIGFQPLRVGSYWTRTAQWELDVCAFDRESGRAFYGECKYHKSKPFSLEEYRALACGAASAPKRSDAEPLLGLFSATGFDEEILRIAESHDSLVLVDCDRRIA